MRTMIEPAMHVKTKHGSNSVPKSCQTCLVLTSEPFLSRLKYRLSITCHDTIMNKCVGACTSTAIEQSCGGTGPTLLLLRILTSRQSLCRLNYRLSIACHDTIMNKCADACTSTSIDQPCGGTVLRCLTEKLDEITDAECKKEVFYFIKMEVTHSPPPPKHVTIAFANLTQGDKRLQVFLFARQTLRLLSGVSFRSNCHNPLLAP